MSIPVVLTAAAEADFDSAADWYEQQAALGAEFTLNVRQTLVRIGQMPELHPIVHRDIRRVTVPKFPYNVYYRARPNRIEVIALLHGRRDPSVWKKRG